jgi:hypothetical protein
VAMDSVQVTSNLEEEGRQEGRQRKLVKVALDTLAEVDFGQHMLLGFTQDVLLSYACSEDETVRKSAALAAWKVTERQWAVLRCAPVTHNQDCSNLQNRDTSPLPSPHLHLLIIAQANCWLMRFEVSMYCQMSTHVHNGFIVKEAGV